MNIANFIDHTNLKPDAREADIAKLCAEAALWKFFSVCVNPAYVRPAYRFLENEGVKVCSVVGFPLGAGVSAAKAFEAERAAGDGASEIDMVINIGALKDGKDVFVREDIRSVVKAVPERIVKVILETSLLTDEEKIRGCLLAAEAGAHFVKTSTGFSDGGAVIHDVKLLRKTVGADLGVKASGGIRNGRTAAAMISAGANRLGTSASVAICKELLQNIHRIVV